MTLRFDPPRQVAKYALFVDHGNGRGFFKPYDDLGSAKNAHRWHNYNNRNNAKILENVDGNWYTLHEVKAGTSQNDLPWYKEVDRYPWYSSRSEKIRKAVPMTREEYAEWRVAVERERIADGSASLDLNPDREFLSEDSYSSGITVIR